MKECSEINLPRYGRVLGAVNAAARQTPARSCAAWKIPKRS